jgi:cytochrome P450
MLNSTPYKLEPEFHQDPHTLYAELRHEPVREVITTRGLKVWLVTGFDEAKAALADPTLSKDIRRGRDLMARHQTTDMSRAFGVSEISAHMLNTDPPDHTRLRKLVNKAFTPRTIEPMRARIAEISTDLLDAMAPLDEVDLLPAFAFPLPITVICELLGVPGVNRDDFREWTSALVEATSVDSVREAGTAMATYLLELIEDKRANPAEDLLTELVHAGDDGDRLNAAELVSMVSLLLIAGHETTVNLIANAVFALLRHPDQLAALRADRSLLPGAIEELLRFDGPVNSVTLRFTTKPITLGGTVIPADEIVLVSAMAANHDPDHYPDADSLDITRDASGHLAFGHGIHFCVGAPLARMEAEIAIGALLDRYDVQLAVPAESLRWRQTMIRGLEKLPLRITPKR